MSELFLVNYYFWNVSLDVDNVLLLYSLYAWQGAIFIDDR